MSTSTKRNFVIASNVRTKQTVITFSIPELSSEMEIGLNEEEARSFIRLLEKSIDYIANDGGLRS